MNSKRIVLLSLFSVFLVLGAFSQSKLQGAGKASKVGTSTSTKTPASNTKSPEVKKPSAASTSGKHSSGNDAKYASVGYMEILGISFANADVNNTIIDNYDSKLYAKEVKYLTPRISYKGLASEEKEITLNIKLFDDDGKLERGTKSPDGFTYNRTVKVETGAGKYLYLSGWGSPKGGIYKAGLYKFEIWYKGNMLYQKEIRLYSGVTPIVQSNILSISSISFANTDKDGNIINDYGQTLYGSKIQYLKPKIYYTGKCSNNQDVVLYVRYFNPSGGLVAGLTSPVGFSFKDNATIQYGSNSVIITGFGNENAATYKEGTYKAEVWMDGEKIYETNVEISGFGSSEHTGGSISSAINSFFPIWNVTLGKTTWKEAEAIGYTVEKWRNGPDRYMDVNDVSFWDHDGSGKFTQIYWTVYNSDFPNSWKLKGFSWNNSYLMWLNAFRNLGFIVKVTKEPKTSLYDGRKTLSAEVEALSKDGMLQFDLDFDYGEDGYSTSSPKTLYSITVRYLDK